jgi:hypothetical protein
VVSERLTERQMRAAFHQGKPKRGPGRPSNASREAEEAEVERIAQRAAAARLGLLEGPEAAEALRAYDERLGPFPRARERLSGYDLPDDIAAALSLFGGGPADG